MFVDTDNDGLSDDKETALADPTNPDDAAADTDGDGISNKDEIAQGTDPNAADSDNDG